MISSLPIRSALAVVVLTIAAVATGCGPAINNNGTSVPTTSIDSGIRVINGSRDVTAFDGYLNATTNLSIAGTINYGTISPFVYITSAPGITLLVQKPGTTDVADRLLTCTLPSLVAGQFYTIVVAGMSTSTTATALQCQVFKEASTTTLGATAGSEMINVHDAAPVLAASGSTTYSFGTYTPAPSPSPVASNATPVPQTYGTPIASVSYVAPASGTNLAFGTSTAVPVPQATTFPGMGVYTQAGASMTAPVSVPSGSYVNPISALSGFAGLNGSGDTTDALPYTTSSTLGVYLLDSQVGTLQPYLVSTMD